MKDQNITLILNNLILECTLNLQASELPNIYPEKQTPTSLVTGHTGPGHTLTKAEPASSKQWRSREPYPQGFPEEKGKEREGLYLPCFLL